MTLRQGPREARQSAQPRYPDDAPGEGLSMQAVPLIGLILLALLAQLRDVWAAQIVLILLVLIVPGIILLRALRVPGTVIAKNPVYLPSASLVLLMASGLAVDLIGPYLGVSQPLRTAPLLLGFEVICLVLLAFSWRAGPETDIPWAAASQPLKVAWPLALPALGAAGALRLNSGQQDGVALVALFTAVAVLAIVFWFATRFSEIVLNLVIYAVSLSMLWSFSFRGDLVYGFDIASEYYAVERTVTAGVWHLAHPNDAYGAMLSLTVLPTEIHAFTGLSALLVYKLVYPAIGALFPVAVYSLARRALAARWAFFAAGLVIMQQTFYQQFPALARQEIATVLFVALISAILDRTMPRRSQWAFVSLLGLSIVVAHYSTTYLAIPLLGISVVLQLVVSLFRPVARFNGAIVITLIVAVVGAFLWYGTLTKSTSNMSQFASVAQDQGLNLLPNQTGNLLQTYLQGEQVKSMTPAQYQQFIHSYYASHYPFVNPLPESLEPQYALQPASDPTPPVTSKLGSSLVNLVTLIIQQLTNVMAGIGSLVLVLRRKVPLIGRQIGLIGLAGMVILMLVRVSGTIAQEYNPQRAFLQMMIILAPTICWPLPSLGSRWKLGRSAVMAACVGSLVIYMASSAGLTSIVLGGVTDTNLANKYADYQDFDMSAQEIASAAWLNDAAAPDDIIYADRYAQLRLTTIVGDRLGVFGDITPGTIDQNSWIYADRTNVLNGIVRSSNGSYSATYAFPKGFIQAYFNTVYTNGMSEVFHR